MGNVDYRSEAKMGRRYEEVVPRCSTVLTVGEVGVVVWSELHDVFPANERWQAQAFLLP